MAAPPDFMLSLLQNIEAMVVSIKEEFPRLSDKDVEFVYGQLKNYFLQRAKGKNIEEPLSTLERKQALIDEILNIIDIREEENLDAGYINSQEFLLDGRPILSVEALYARAFNKLSQSVRFWRKKDGYLKYIKNSF